MVDVVAVDSTTKVTSFDLNIIDNPVLSVVTYVKKYKISYLNPNNPILFIINY